MLLFNILLVVTAVSALLAAVFWLRVASSRSLNAAFKLDGTEELSRRANRRAFNWALAASIVTLLLVGATYFAGRFG